MAMEIGIVGLPGAGKTSLFNALAGSDVPLFSPGMKPNVGIAPIPDPRLHTIAQYIPTKQIVHSTLKLVDIPGVPAGSGAEKVNSFLEHVRQVHALCQVVKCFEDANPAKDIENLQTEFALADLVVAESAKDKAQRVARSGDKEALQRIGVLDRVIATTSEGQPIRSAAGWSEADHKVLRSYGFVTGKPVLYVANVDEASVDGSSDFAAITRKQAEAAGGQCIAVCASLEAELGQLEEADRREMLESLGLSEPAIGPLARGLNELLGLACFYTAGDKEVRAWTIRSGETAPEAAGSIHSDIQRGFIRAECYHIDDLVKHKSEKAIREAGRLRSEGKNYIMQDGDVVHFLFNV